MSDKVSIASETSTMPTTVGVAQAIGLPTKLSEKVKSDLSLKDRIIGALRGGVYKSQELEAIVKREMEAEREVYFHKLGLYVTNAKLNDYANYQVVVAELKARTKLVEDKFAADMADSLNRVRLYFGQREKIWFDKLEESFSSGNLTQARYERTKATMEQEFDGFIGEVIERTTILKDQQMKEFRDAIGKFAQA